MGASLDAPSQFISLPKGGGAVHGMGETFTPVPQTGAGTLSIPILVPPGRNGFQPRLNLAYSTATGQGEFGLGWSLDIPRIARKTSKGLPRYQDDHSDPREHDTLVLSGAEDLVALDGAAAPIVRFQPRTEGLFAQIERTRGASGDYWIVRGKDGLESVYGTPRPAQPAAGWSDPAIIARVRRAPGEMLRIFAWLLTQTRDPFGNRIEYLYEERDQSTPEEIRNGHDTRDQPLLSEIRYVDYEGFGQTRHLNTIRFEYETRTDALSEYRAAFEVRCTRRCKAIVIETHADVDRRVRRYELDYVNTGLNGVSQLAAVHVLGYEDAGAAVEELPPLEFSYTRFDPQNPRRRAFMALTGRHLPSFSLAEPSLELVDLFGSGLPDFLQLDDYPRYWRNRGHGHFDAPCTLPEAPEGFALANAGVQLLDANGDGRADLLITQPGLAGYFPLEAGALWDRGSFRRYASAPSIDLESPHLRFVDLTGDGVTDVIRSGSGLDCFFNDPNRGWERTRRIARRPLDDFPDVDFADDRVRLADMTGDGLQDIVYVYDGNVAYWPNLGYGDWGRRIYMRNSPRLPYHYNPARLLIGDVDGDGLADVIYVDDRKVYFWINRCGNAWSEAIVIEGTPPVTDMDAVRLTDLLGSGVAGVLWTGDALSSGQPHSFFLDLTGEQKPYLLREMTNNMGARTRVGYTSSTAFYLADEPNQETRWKTTLPFPVQVVSRVETLDEISGGKLTTEYRYHDGHWDGGEREPRGFGRVDRFDSESFEDYSTRGLHGPDTAFTAVDREYFAAPTCTRTWFHVGPVGKEYGAWEEFDRSAQYWSGDPSLLRHVDGVDAFIRTLPDRRMRRDALRSLRGAVLRTELYALDGSVREDRPLTVTEHAYALREESAPASGSSRQRIFFPHVVAQRTTQWERGDNPMTRVSFTSDYDVFGNPGTQLDVACPRGWRRPADALPGATYLATLTRTQVAVPQDASVYIHDRVARTVSYEIVNLPTAAGRTLAQIRRLALSPRRLRLFAESLNYYDDDPAAADRGAFRGLPFGVVGRFGAVTRSESLALTEDILTAAYGADRAPYLRPGQTFAASADYPAGFVQHLNPLAGYVFHPSSSLGAHAGGHYVTTTSRRFDFHAGGPVRGLVLAERDPLGAETGVEYDQPYNVLPAAITNATGLSTRVTYDYRVMQPTLVTDANGNRTRIDFTPAGLVSALWLMGKPNQGDGDITRPSSTFQYAFRAFFDGATANPNAPPPAYSRTVRNTRHDSDPDDTGESIETREYSDGFGRVLQVRTQAEPVRFGDAIFGGGDSVLPASQDAASGATVVGVATDEHVIISGAQRYNNKGHAVEKYEPSFSTGWSYTPAPGSTDPLAHDSGSRVTLFYDAVGRLIRTVNADGSEQRILHGVPNRIEDPTDAGTVTPTPWESYTYDANDNAGRTHATASAGYRHHWNTPTSIVVDALGRTVLSVVRNRATAALATDPLAAEEEYRTRFTYDIQGNLLVLTDSLNRSAFAYVHDLARHALRTSSLDAGDRWLVFDAAGQEIERRDGKEARVLRTFDVLNRPNRAWMRDAVGESMTLRAVSEYGDAGTRNQPPTERSAAHTANLLGRPSRQFDEAGEVVFGAYDFKGNLLEKTRSVIANAPIISALNASGGPARRFVVDWDHAPGLEGNHQISSTFDALNRLTLMQYPRDVTGARKTLVPTYNRAGTLATLAVDGAVFIERIAYNAKGQRVLIAYGNRVLTRYAYDLQTFQLARLRTERFTSAAANSYRPQGQPLQDLAYTHDLAGNVTRVSDRTPGCGMRNNPEALLSGSLGTLLTAGDALVRRFDYDPLYRLISATGREADGMPTDERPWEDLARDGFGWGASGTPTPSSARDGPRLYTETFAYDAADNLLSLQHDSWRPNRRSTWKRSFGLTGNQLTHVGDSSHPGPGQTHFFDANGGVIRENTERHFAWDAQDRMVGFAIRAGGGAASVEACYLFDARGRRVKKLVRRGASVETTVYVDDVFEHHVAGTAENNALHIMDDKKRVAVLRVGAPLQNDTGPIVQYALADHLHSATIVIGGDDAAAAAFVNREEFFPYGETSFGSFGRKRFRFAGKERDEESGLSYFGARFYAAHLARWVSCDPLSPTEGANTYVYCHDSPFDRCDPDGRAVAKPEVDAIDSDWAFPSSLGSWSARERAAPSHGPLSAPPNVRSQPSLEELKSAVESQDEHAKELFTGEIPTGEPGWSFMEVWTTPEEVEQRRQLLPQSIREFLGPAEGYYTTRRVYSPYHDDAPASPASPEPEEQLPTGPPPSFEMPTPGTSVATDAPTTLSLTPRTVTSGPTYSMVFGKPKQDLIGLPLLGFAFGLAAASVSALSAPNLGLSLLTLATGMPIQWSSGNTGPGGVPWWLMPVLVSHAVGLVGAYFASGLRMERDDTAE